MNYVSRRKIIHANSGNILTTCPPKVQNEGKTVERAAPECKTSLPTLSAQQNKLRLATVKEDESEQLREWLNLLATPELAALGPEQRSRREKLASLELKLEALGKNVNLSSRAQSLIRSLVLLWHDHLDESHSISQEIPSSDGSFLHGIMHRREPDYWNSKYWFQRVGNHPAFPEIARRVEALLKNVNASLLQKNLLPDGKWNPLAFVDACERAAKNKSDGKEIQLLQQIQEIEFRVLLEHFLSANNANPH
jgi:hypothetical protein